MPKRQPIWRPGKKLGGGNNLRRIFQVASLVDGEATPQSRGELSAPEASASPTRRLPMRRHSERVLGGPEPWRLSGESDAGGNDADGEPSTPRSSWSSSKRG